MSVQEATKQAKALGLQRKIALAERGLLWWLLGFVVFAVLALGFVLIAQGRMAKIDPDVWGSVMRGYTGYGELLGVAAVFFALASMLFSLRKRVLQERFAILRGTMMGWLWAHVVAGVLTLAAASLHAGFGLMDYKLSTGKLLYWLLLAISISGIIWRLVYSWVPKSNAAKIGNYSRAISVDRAKRQELEIEKLAAGRSDSLRQWKDWLLATEHNAGELQHAQAQFAGGPEAAIFAQLCELAQSRNRALARARLQQKVISKLQGWRVVHVPLSLLFMLLIVVHVIEVYDIPAKHFPRSVRSMTSMPPALTGHHDPAACGECHATIYKQWQDSMHAHALTSPLMIAQSNQVTKKELNNAESPDPKRICVNCHAPITTELAQQELLPYPGGKRMNEGITCTVCHQFDGKSEIGGGAYTHVVIDQLDRGRVMYGTFSGAVGNTYHQSRVSKSLSDDASLICQNCHDVNFDRSGDGKVEIGTDLVLQTTYQEYIEYRAGGGQETCTGCHMPVVRGLNRVAEASGLGQDTQAPDRSVHDHSFVGVDHPLDVPGKLDPHRKQRVALLGRAADFKLLDPKFNPATREFKLTVSITNVGAGHTLPSGFAFARQMWVEFIARDGIAKRAIFASGLLVKNTDDLCDTGTFDDPQSPIRELMQGCTRSDPQLVNFQKKLVDKADVQRDAQGNPVRNQRGELIPIAAPGSSETSIQRVAGNPITRRRPIDNQLMGSILPGQERQFTYSVTVPPGITLLDLRARLLFRNLPPYFVRDIARNQPGDEKPQLEPMVKNLDIVEMETAQLNFNLPNTAADPALGLGGAGGAGGQPGVLGGAGGAPGASP